MSPYNDSLFSKGPTMLLSPNQHSQLLTPDTSMASSPFSSVCDASSASNYIHHSTSWTPSSGLPPISTNPSRKRSRDESSVDSLSADGSYFPTQAVNTPATIPEEEPVYGEGMTLLNPRTGLSIAAESQTGTWYEEKAEADLAKSLPSSAAVRPEMPTSRKSQRLDSTAPKPDDIVQAALPDSPTKLAAASSPEPAVDNFTLSLGIGWTRIAQEDSAVQAAARGWAKYIDNHFSDHVHGAEILLKSKGLNAYLVGSQQGFFLFGEDLSEGRLVGRTWEKTLSNLQSQPIVFEGEQTLTAAAKSPTLEPSSGRGLVTSCFGAAIQNGTNSTWSMTSDARLNPSAERVMATGAGGMDLD